MSAQKWNKTVLWPTESGYVCRIVGLDFTPSKNTGNPMLKISWETVSLNGSQEVQIGSETFNIAGVETDTYHVTTNLKADKTIDNDATAKSQKRFKKMMEDLEFTEDLNWDNLKPQLEPYLMSKLVFCYMTPDEVERTADPTADELNAGLAQGLKLKEIKGRVLKNPKTGRILIDYYPKVREVFGLAPQDGMQMAY